MRITELQEKLEEVLDEYGDLEILLFDQEVENVEPAYYVDSETGRRRRVIEMW